mgnify:CR=1 FL=1
MSSWPLLSIVTFLPLAGALFIFLLGRAEGEAGDRNAKWVALWTTLATFAFAVMVWVQFDPANPGFQMVEEAPWLGGGVSYKMGVDGISVLFVVLTAFLMPAAILCSWSSIEVRVVPLGTSLKDALLEMTRKGLGMTAVLAADGTLAGIFTDGDLRRTLDRSLDLAGLSIDDVMHPQPRTIAANLLATEAAKEMELRKINGLLVVDEHGRLIGALNMHDLLKAGVV